MNKIRKYISFALITLTVAVNVLILVESLIPGKISEAQSDWVTEVIAYVVKVEPTSELAFNIRKAVGHFSLFLLNGLISTATLLFILNKKNRLILTTSSLFFGIFIASLSEIFQLFTYERYGTIEDIQTDFSGYLVGAFIIFFIFTFIAFIRNKRVKTLQNHTII